jgi:hypothetical protein
MIGCILPHPLEPVLPQVADDRLVLLDKFSSAWRVMPDGVKLLMRNRRVGIR